MKTKQLERAVPSSFYRVYQDLTGSGIEIYYGKINDLPHAIGFRGKQTKNDFWYRFPTHEERENHVAKYIANVRQILQDKKDHKARQQQLGSPPNPFKLGDILHGSWGYEQTNCEFVQVVEVLNRSVKVRKIGTYQVESNGLSSMAANVLPIKDKFFGEPILKKVGFVREGQGYLSFKCWTAFLWDGKPEYSSWYA